MNKYTSLLLLMMASLCSMQCSSTGQTTRSEKAKAARIVKPVPVAVERPSTGRAFDFYATTSTLEAEFQAEIRSKANGVVVKLMVEEGRRVMVGDILLELENEDQTLDLKQAQISFDQAQKEYKRNQVIHSKGVLSDEVYEQSENAFQTASANLEIAQLKMSYTQVKSPLDGVLVKRLVDLGAHIDQGTSLFNVMDMEPLLVRIHVPANRMAEINVGQLLEMECDSTRTLLKGEIQLISPIVDPTTGTVKITASIHNYPASVKPGEFVKVRLITRQKAKALLVPTISIFEEKGQKIVFVIEDGVSKKRKVDVGLSTEEKTEILSGVSGSDLVVTKGQRDLRDGQRVMIPEAHNAKSSESSKNP